MINQLQFWPQAKVMGNWGKRNSQEGNLKLSNIGFQWTILKLSVTGYLNANQHRAPFWLTQSFQVNNMNRYFLLNIHSKFGTTCNHLIWPQSESQHNKMWLFSSASWKTFFLLKAQVILGKTLWADLLTAAGSLFFLSWPDFLFLLSVLHFLPSISLESY